MIETSMDLLSLDVSYKSLWPCLFLFFFFLGFLIALPTHHPAQLVAEALARQRLWTHNGFNADCLPTWPVIGPLSPCSAKLCRHRQARFLVILTLNPCDVQLGDWLSVLLQSQGNEFIDPATFPIFRVQTTVILVVLKYPPFCSLISPRK